jgi:hypothetical protein
MDKPWDLHIVVYAVPWAEARFQWPRDSVDSLDEQDDDGRLFRDYVREAFDVIDRDGDLEKYQQLEKRDTSRRRRAVHPAGHRDR